MRPWFNPQRVGFVDGALAQVFEAARIRSDGLEAIDPMVINQRKTPRKPISRPAAIHHADGTRICECRLIDISDAGARFKILAAKDSAGIELPQQFILAISKSGNVFRRCQLIWTSEGEAGVQFTSPQKGKPV